MVANVLTHTTHSGRPDSSACHKTLESLCAHSRAMGACLLLLKPDGAPDWVDPEAPVFFRKYLVPSLAPGSPVARAVSARVETIGDNSSAQTWNILPGVLIAVAPFMQRRQLTGILALAGRSTQMPCESDLRSACGGLWVDPHEVYENAQAVPGSTPEQLAAMAGLLLSTLVEQQRAASLEQELTSLSTQLANAYEELTLIDQISGGMRVNRRSADFFRQACLDVMQVICMRAMGVVVQNEKLHDDPELYGELSLPPAHLQRLADQLLNTLRERKSAFLLNDLRSDRSYQWLCESATRLIAVPLLRRDQVLGCLFGLDKAGGEFDSVDAKLLSSIANESAIYLENAMLFGDVHDLLMGLLHSLTSAIDAKDAYTCGHSDRVAQLSRHLAGRLDLPEDEIDRIYMAGLLHDVGKIGIPESVLQKTGRLTPEEFELMKKHCEIGARILSEIKQMEDVLPGVLHHHERFDGKGYPAGLAGRDIPLMGRIICLADCFDAMTSNRTYRKALPLEVALSEIRRCSGTQFDPSLAELFLQITPDQFRMLVKESRPPARVLISPPEALRAA